MVIRAVILDLGRVVVPFDFARAYARVSAKTGMPVAEVGAKVRETGLLEPFESGQISPPDFATRLSRQLNLNVGYEEFREIWNSIFLPSPLLPDTLLRGLAKNYPLVLLSNTNEIHFTMLREAYPILRHFHSFVLSYEVGAMKPSPLIYQRAVAECGFPANECFFTDDVPEYVEGARAFGIDAVPFLSSEQLQAELRSRGVRWDEAGQES